MTSGERNAIEVSDRLARVLRQEIVAIGRGDLGEVAAYHDEKLILLEKIQLVFDLFESGDKFVGAERNKFRSRLMEIQSLIAEDLILLERITKATAAIAAEISNLRERHGLSGLYDREGGSISGVILQNSRIDRTF